MNNKERRKLCKHYERLNDFVNSLYHTAVLKGRNTGIEAFDNLIEEIIDKNVKVKEGLYEMFNDFDAGEIYEKEFCDPHTGCYSYPNCDEAPLGCCVVHGLDAEPYGHR